jgi:hypothetical protein
VIKISKDSLFISSRVVPILALIGHVFAIFVCIIINTWFAYVFYFVTAIIHFFLVRIWRLWYLNDVYINEGVNKLIFKNLNGDEIEVDRNQIIKRHTYFGITEILAQKSQNKIKKYAKIESKYNLKYLSRNGKMIFVSDKTIS